MMPNNDQIQAAVRWILTISGPIGAYLISRGMTVESLTAFVSSVLVIFGALPPIISLVWGIHAHTDDAKLAVVEAMPDVKAIVAVANPNPEGAVIAAAENPKRRKVVET